MTSWYKPYICISLVYTNMTCWYTPSIYQVFSSIRLWEYVRASQDATTGRSGLCLLRDDEGRASLGIDWTLRVPMEPATELGGLDQTRWARTN